MLGRAAGLSLSEPAAFGLRGLFRPRAATVLVLESRSVQAGMGRVSTNQFSLKVERASVEFQVWGLASGAGQSLGQFRRGKS